MPSGTESGPSGGPVFEPLIVFRAERVCKTTTASSGQLKYFFQKSKSQKQVSKQTHQTHKTKSTRRHKEATNVIEIRKFNRIQHNFYNTDQIVMKIRRQSAESRKINPDLEKYEFLEDSEPRTLVRPFLLSEIIFYYIVIYLEFRKIRSQS